MTSPATSVDAQIIKFIRKHHILTLATSSNNMPYCCTCFYTYNAEQNVFIITSELHTRHIQEAEKQSAIAGAIALETRIIGKLQGIQFTGTIKELKGEEFKTYRKEYLKRFPYAAPFLHDTPFWALYPDFIKLTDNILGFGKKLIWTQR